jgi:hypothetical protein
MMVQNNAAAFQLIPMLIGISVGLAIGVAINAIFCYFVSDALAKVPAEYHQNISPGQVWLLLIPLFNIVWNFFVSQRVPDTFRVYFEATGRPQPGDYGKQLGLIYSILACCVFIPCLGSLCGFAALVILIILVVKFSGFKSLIVSGGGSGFPPIMPPQA